MRSSLAITTMSTMIFAAFAFLQIPISRSLTQSGPQSQPPAGDGAAGRGSVAPGGTFQFKQLKITVLATMLDSGGAKPHHIARIRLQEGGATEEMTARQGESGNWHGYHVAIAAVHGPGEVGGERVELVVATVASLPQCVGKPIGKDSPWPCTSAGKTGEN